MRFISSFSSPGCGCCCACARSKRERGRCTAGREVECAAGFRYDGGEAGDGWLLAGRAGAAACADERCGEGSAGGGRGDDPGAARESSGLPNVRNAEHRETRGDDERYDLPRLLDDEGGHRGCNDEAVPAGEVAAFGPDIEVRSGVCAFEGLCRDRMRAGR